MTVLTARVDKKLWENLREIYNEKTLEVPNEIHSSYLVQNTDENDNWQIVTIWKTEEALQAMRSSGETPTGIQVFKAVNASPELTVFDIVENALIIK
ncbi:MAG TPA: hypothetical protein VLF79_04410 [Candidatus Saccharimonadales bacterium]|nr:hypothetical protein [Candidatus Saccharimonadales bacterium]